MKKHGLLLMCVIFTFTLSAQITPKNLQGTWTLCSMNSIDDTSLVIVYDDQFDATQFYPNHAINNVWELRDPSKHKYLSEYSKIQLADEITLSFLENFQNAFWQFDTLLHYKDNNATDSTYTYERVQYIAAHSLINEGEMPSYNVSNDTLYLLNAIDGFGSLFTEYAMYEKNNYLVLSGGGTTYIIKNRSRTPLFPFEFKTQE